MKVVGLVHVSLYVRDLDASRRFYSELLGLPVVQDEDWGARIRAGSVDLFLHPKDHDDAAAQHVELVFDVEDVDGAFGELRHAGVTILEEPTDRAWGDRDGAVADPDGNTIYLRQSR